MGSSRGLACEVGAIRYGSRVLYGRDLLGRISGSERISGRDRITVSRSDLGVEIGSRDRVRISVPVCGYWISRGLSKLRAA